MNTLPECGVSLVIGSYNRKSFLKATIESVRHNAITVPFEMIVIDGGSSDGTVQWLTQQKDIITIVQHNRGKFRGHPIARRSWGYFMNLGFKCAQGKFIVMLSDDALVVSGSIMHAITQWNELSQAGRKIGAIAFYWRNWPVEKEYRVGLTFGGKMFVNHGLFLREALEQIGWVDEERYRFYHADGDLGLRIWRMGYEVVDCPTAYVEHFTHANFSVRRTNLAQQQQDFQAYLNRWQEIYPDVDLVKGSGAIYRSYTDPHHTTARFPKLPALVLQLLWRWRHRIRKTG